VTARLAVLVSGSGTNLQALLDATDPPYEVVAVGADRPAIEGLARAERRGIPTFVEPLGSGPREDFDARVLAALDAAKPDLVVLAGYMKILGAPVVSAYPMVNTHPALLPSFPGAHAVRQALAHGVTVSGVTVHLVDAGVDTGPILAQEAVPVLPDDDEESLHERIKVAERRLLVDTVSRMCRAGWRVEGRKVVLL
jgi:phosphoribosylglycinamide formyltransferase-1